MSPRNLRPLLAELRAELGGLPPDLVDDIVQELSVLALSCSGFPSHRPLDEQLKWLFGASVNVKKKVRETNVRVRRLRMPGHAYREFVAASPRSVWAEQEPLVKRLYEEFREELGDSVHLQGMFEELARGASVGEFAQRNEIRLGTAYRWWKKIRQRYERFSKQRGFLFFGPLWPRRSLETTGSYPIASFGALFIIWLLYSPSFAPHPQTRGPVPDGTDDIPAPVVACKRGACSSSPSRKAEPPPAPSPVVVPPIITSPIGAEVGEAPPPESVAQATPEQEAQATPEPPRPRRPPALQLVRHTLDRLDRGQPCRALRTLHRHARWYPDHVTASHRSPLEARALEMMSPEAKCRWRSSAAANSGRDHAPAKSK